MSQARKLGCGSRATVGNLKVGKRMGDDLYVHKAYSGCLAGWEKAAASLPADFEYAIVKHNKKTGAFSFIASPDFDTADEPTVGNAIKVSEDGTTSTTRMKQDPQIYHHKWSMVGDDYDGFDMCAAIKRSIHWKGIVGKNAKLSSRIGTKSVWDSEVVPRL